MNTGDGSGNMGQKVLSHPLTVKKTVLSLEKSGLL